MHVIRRFGEKAKPIPEFDNQLIVEKHQGMSSSMEITTRSDQWDITLIVSAHTYSHFFQQLRACHHSKLVLILFQPVQVFKIVLYHYRLHLTRLFNFYSQQKKKETVHRILRKSTRMRWWYKQILAKWSKGALWRWKSMTMITYARFLAVSKRASHHVTAYRVCLLCVCRSV